MLAASLAHEPDYWTPRRDDVKSTRGLRQLGAEFSINDKRVAFTHPASRIPHPD